MSLTQEVAHPSNGDHQEDRLVPGLTLQAAFHLWIAQGDTVHKSRATVSRPRRTDEEE